jgi:two-component system LytT family sensor kinase
MNVPRACASTEVASLWLCVVCATAGAGAALALDQPPVAIVACGLALASGLRLARSFHAKEAEIASSRLAALQAELKAFRMQLNPHFLFNALSAISALVADQRPAEARELTERLAMLCREMARMEEDSVPVRDEIEMAESYIAMATIRFGDRLKADIRIDPATLSLGVPNMILQPLVENAVKHGVERTDGEVELHLAAHLDRRHLVLEVENRGGGAPACAQPHSARGGIGLANTRARLMLLFGAGAALDAQPLEKGYRAQIRLPLNALPLQGHARAA